MKIAEVIPKIKDGLAQQKTVAVRCDKDGHEYYIFFDVETEPCFGGREAHIKITDSEDTKMSYYAGILKLEEKVGMLNLNVWMASDVLASAFYHLTLGVMDFSVEEIEIEN